MHFKKLEILQSKTARIITEAFKAIFILALNIEVSLIAIHHMLDKLVIKSTLQILETFFLNLFLITRSK